MKDISKGIKKTLELIDLILGISLKSIILWFAISFISIYVHYLHAAS